MRQEVKKKKPVYAKGQNWCEKRMLVNIKRSALEVINHQKKFEASNQANPTTLKVLMWECNMLVQH